MSDNAEKIVLVGTGETAQIAYEYISLDSPYEIVAFSEEREFRKKDSLYELPVVDFEQIDTLYPPDQYKVFVAVSYNKLNRIRTRLFLEAKSLGYSAISYISSHAFVWRNVDIGENCFIFENNVLQHKVKIEDNVILWSGNHVGHQTRIKKNCYISSHCVISGYCEIGESSFLGVNCCFNDGVIVADDCVIGSGTVIRKNTKKGKVYVGNPAKPIPKSSYETFSV